jgi:hypothetical protein
MKNRTVRHLRVAPRPYDHERDDTGVTITLSPIEWSILVAGAERSTIADCREVAARVAREVLEVQRLRIQADIADAEYDCCSPCEWPDGA